MKKLIRRFLPVTAFLISVSPFAMADGLVADGHVNGAHTNLFLTTGQMWSLIKGQSEISLTADQKRQLQKLPNASSVTKLLVLPADTETCTCELSNVAVQVNPFMIEVSNALFGRNLSLEYADTEKSMREEEDKAFAEQHTHRDSKELLLCKQAKRVAWTDPEAAAALYEQALKINPYLIDAKIQLRIARNNLAIKQKRLKLKQPAAATIQQP